MHLGTLLNPTLVGGANYDIYFLARPKALRTTWWMRLMSQNIAQRANREGNEVGRFVQARYRAVRLLDETAILACAAYVDLNPIRAAMTDSIEGSDHTSAKKRNAGLRRECSVGSIQCSENADDGKGPRLGDTGNGEWHLAAVGLVPSAERRVYGTRGGGSRLAGHCVLPTGRLSSRG